jgi:hypothetical protein
MRTKPSRIAGCSTISFLVSALIWGSFVLILNPSSTALRVLGLSVSGGLFLLAVISLVFYFIMRKSNNRPSL